MTWLLFSSFLYDLFIIIKKNYFAYHADNTTLYVIGNNPEEVVSKLIDLIVKLFLWFSQDKIKASLGK